MVSIAIKLPVISARLPAFCGFKPYVSIQGEILETTRKKLIVYRKSLSNNFVKNKK